LSHIGLNVAFVSELRHCCEVPFVLLYTDEAITEGLLILHPSILMLGYLRALVARLVPDEGVSFNPAT
jgi:hypothetical protein